MRPCPRRYIHYVWHMDGRDKPSLQAAMGMIGDDSGFKFILVLSDHVGHSQDFILTPIATDYYQANLSGPWSRPESSVPPARSSSSGHGEEARKCLSVAA